MKQTTPLLEGGPRVCAKATTKEHLFCLLLTPPLDGKAYSDGASKYSETGREKQEQKTVRFACDKTTGVRRMPTNTRSGERFRAPPLHFFKHFSITCTNEKKDGSFWRVSAGKVKKAKRTTNKKKKKSNKDKSRAQSSSSSSSAFSSSSSASVFRDRKHSSAGVSGPSPAFPVALRPRIEERAFDV